MQGYTLYYLCPQLQGDPVRLTLCLFTNQYMGWVSLTGSPCICLDALFISLLKFDQRNIKVKKVVRTIIRLKKSSKCRIREIRIFDQPKLRFGVVRVTLSRSQFLHRCGSIYKSSVVKRLLISGSTQGSMTYLSDRS